jgi:lipoprotein signal peptidase
MQNQYQKWFNPLESVLVVGLLLVIAYFHPHRKASHLIERLIFCGGMSGIMSRLIFNE